MTPWLGRPTSYASGYIRHHRTSAASQSFTVEFSSPPTYWIGFCTLGSSGSRRPNSDSTGMAGDDLTELTAAGLDRTYQRNPAGAGSAGAGAQVDVLQQPDRHHVGEH